VMLQPKHSYFLRAVVYFRLRQYDRVVSDCNAELQIVPDDANAKMLRDQAQALLDHSSH